MSNPNKNTMREGLMAIWKTPAIGSLSLLLALAAIPCLARMNFYVAPNGNDAWSGYLPYPNRTHTDGPFATLGRAQQAVRAFKKQHPTQKEGITVWLEGGRYELHQTFALTAADGGTAQAPVRYAAWHRQTVSITGGKLISHWQPVTDPHILERLPEAARGHVLQCDLHSQGIQNFGQLTRRGFGLPIVPAPLELFFRGEPMQLARWPLHGYTTIATTPAGPQGGEFGYEGDEPSRWSNDHDVWVHGYWTFDWADSYEKIASIDTAKHLIHTVPPHGVYGYQIGSRWYALNILEELAAPGEYYLDRDTGVLYFWPPASIHKGDTEVSILTTPLITLTDASHVILDGLTIECGRGCGVQIVGGDHNLLVHCTLRNFGEYAASIGDDTQNYQNAIYANTLLNRQSGSHNGIEECAIYNTGSGGVLLGGGDRQTLTPGGNFVIGCTIHDYNRWDFTYRAGVNIDGVGNLIAYNAIYNAPHNAILLSGNNHLIEFNDIHDVCLDTGDAGAFYMGRDLSMRGNTVRYNYFHNIEPHIQRANAFEGVQSVYLDDCASGTTVYGNIFFHAGCAVMIGGGRDNTVDNNLFLDCDPAIHVDARGLSWAKDWFNGKDPILISRLEAVHYNRPPYSIAYPHLANILQDDPAVPKYNTITHNICVGGTWIQWLDGMNDHIVTVQNNLVTTDPGFLDPLAPEKRGFELLPRSPALHMGFRPIPFNQIGPKGF
ncbi:MAG TPA: right-handed parallel beta-helix repeat-containing protein, partial [Chthonomonas sp.]|uniref:right-handed parallel beta-helix repeat-containing protein n=1 Tax=Chthonomonas sp. TaxID=2282153 RepID=UPI002B4B4245